jgi:hypothetical protein
MRWMNTYEIDEAVPRWRRHLVLGPATRTLANLRDAADANSDGWCYWAAPARAAARLMELIERDGTHRYRFDDRRPDATVVELRTALRPIKAFRSRTKLDFKVEGPRPADRAQAGCQQLWLNLGAVTEV